MKTTTWHCSRVGLQGKKKIFHITKAMEVFSTISIRFFYNQLSGTIPDAVGSVLRLRDLALYSNWLAGEIPGAIASQKELVL